MIQIILLMLQKSGVHQLILENIRVLNRVSAPSQVVGNGISEPSTVVHRHSQGEHGMSGGTRSLPRTLGMPVPRWRDFKNGGGDFDPGGSLSLSKIEWDLTNGPLSKLLELLDTQV